MRGYKSPSLMRATYLYNGWHPCPERDAAMGPGFVEWDLLKRARPMFEGHRPPGFPRGGPYDDRDPRVWDERIGDALRHGVDVLVSGWFWSRGKTVFEKALLDGFLRCGRRDDARFAVFWANRMPHRVLPLRASDPEAADPRRLVHTDATDFVALIEDLAARFFGMPNYWRLDGRPYFSIFDTTLFLRQLGAAGAARAISRAKDRVGGLYLTAIDPDAPWRTLLREIGFDAVTHYVRLPIWKGGARVQDYDALTRLREAEWPAWRDACGLPYFPSCSPGWDATPRGAWHPEEPPHRHPWAPVVVGATPRAFGAHVAAAERFVAGEQVPGIAVADRPVFLASWNEWTEGHAIEPSERDGAAWLEAIGDAAAGPRREASRRE